MFNTWYTKILRLTYDAPHMMFHMLRLTPDVCPKVSKRSVRHVAFKEEIVESMSKKVHIPVSCYLLTWSLNSHMSNGDARDLDMWHGGWFYLSI